MSSPQLKANTESASVQCVISVRELVKGEEEQFLVQLRPLVNNRSVRLDLSSIERIDAAGLGALVALYCEACKAGYEFAVVNPTRNVARMLAIVGLDRILLPEGSRDMLSQRPPLDLVAA